MRAGGGKHRRPVGLRVSWLRLRWSSFHIHDCAATAFFAQMPEIEREAVAAIDSRVQCIAWMQVKRFVNPGLDVEVLA